MDRVIHLRTTRTRTFFSSPIQSCTSNIYLLRAVLLNFMTDSRAPSKPLFTKIKILDIFSIYSLQASSIMYLYHNNLLRLSFCQIFQTGCQIHYSTRNSESYRSHPCRTNIKKFSILFQEPKLYGTPYLRVSKQLQVFTLLNDF